LQKRVAQATLFFLCYNPDVLIDSHTHIFPPEIIKERESYLRIDAEFASIYSRPAARLETAEELIESMDKSGVDMSIACGFGWQHKDLCKRHNDYILESIARFPKRLAGLVIVVPETDDGALAELERCVKAGARGIGEMRPSVETLDTSHDSLWTGIASLLVEKSLVCLFHASDPVGHPYPGKGGLTPEALYPFIARHQDLKFVLAHWGGGMPFYGLMPEVKRALANTWFDTAASRFLYSPGVYKQAAEIIGTDRILFGSDYPLMPQSRAVDDIKQSDLPADSVAAILGLNASRLFGIADG
jgi:uncharacterized protein